MKETEVLFASFYLSYKTIVLYCDNKIKLLCIDIHIILLEKKLQRIKQYCQHISTT